jgi:hypothetical protein
MGGGVSSLAPSSRCPAAHNSGRRGSSGPCCVRTYSIVSTCTPDWPVASSTLQQVACAWTNFNMSSLQAWNVSALCLVPYAHVLYVLGTLCLVRYARVLYVLGTMCLAPYAHALPSLLIHFLLCFAGAATNSPGAGTTAGDTTPAPATTAAAAAEVGEDAAAAGEEEEETGPVCAEQQESLLGVQLKVEVLTALVSKMEHLVGRAEATARALQVGGRLTCWAAAAPTAGAAGFVCLGPTWERVID